MANLIFHEIVIGKDLHINRILELAQRNQYYFEDLSLILKPESMYTQLKQKYDIDKEDILKYSNRNQYLTSMIGFFILKNFKPIGFILASNRFDEMKRKDWIHIEFLLIDKEHRNKGYGSSLIKKLIEYLSLKKIDIITIDPDDEYLAKYYKKLGFTKTSIFLNSETNKISKFLLFKF